ncbi:hypothetical protein BH10BAC1_BH10BAC1_02290 [soil metagenome]
MQTNTSIAELKESIRCLEIKQAEEGQLLKEQFKVTYESLKPINLIKSTLKEFTSVPDLKSELLNTTVGMAAGYFAKSKLIGDTESPLKKALGTLLQIGVTSVVSKNADNLKSVAQFFIKNILKKKEQLDS